MWLAPACLRCATSSSRWFALTCPDPLLVYLPQRQEADGRATLLELIRAGTVFEAQLVNRARVYLREVMEPEKVEQLLKRPDLTYRDIAIALEQSGEGGFSQLKALFRQQLGGMGSPPENAELARLWLASDQFDAGISAKGLQSELQDLLHSRWGLGFPADATLADWRQRAQRALLLHEFLHDWHGDELTAFAKQSLPVGKAAEENALTDVKALRRNHASAYIAIAARVEEELGLRELISSERPGRARRDRHLPLRGAVPAAQRRCLPRQGGSRQSPGAGAGPPGQLLAGGPAHRSHPVAAAAAVGSGPYRGLPSAWPSIRQKPSCPSQRLPLRIGWPTRRMRPTTWMDCSDGWSSRWQT